MQIIKQISLIVSIVFLIINTSISQTLTSSPYSRYGIGDIASKGFGRNKALGNIGIGLRSPYHLNITNPASYSSMDSLSFIYEFGVNGKQTKYVTKNLNYTNNNVNINYVAIGFPITNFWFSSIGLIPYSSIGYKIKTDSVYQNIGKVENNYTGNGGINQFYIGNSIKLFKKLSIGINISYLFGSLEQINSTTFPDDVNAFELYSDKKIKISDFCFNYGLQYSDSIKHKYGYTLGLIFDNQTKINASNSVLYTNYMYSSEESTLDTIVYTDSQKGNILLPVNAGMGLTIYNDKFTFGLDYKWQNWEKAKFFDSTYSLVNSNYIGFGIEYIPDIKSITNYSDRIRYRIGGHFNNTYLKIRENQITDYGISLGIGLPLRKTKTTFNIGFEFGTRGTTKSNLIRENYGIISLNITFYDNWFARHKFE